MTFGIQVISAFHQYWENHNQFPIIWTITIFLYSETKSPDNLLITFYSGFIWFLHTIFAYISCLLAVCGVIYFTSTLHIFMHWKLQECKSIDLINLASSREQIFFVCIFKRRIPVKFTTHWFVHDIWLLHILCYDLLLSTQQGAMCRQSKEQVKGWSRIRPPLRISLL